MHAVLTCHPQARAHTHATTRRLRIPSCTSSLAALLFDLTDRVLLLESADRNRAENISR